MAFVQQEFTGLCDGLGGCAIRNNNQRICAGLLFFAGLFLFFVSGCSDGEEKTVTVISSRPSESRLEQRTSLSLPSVVTIPENISSAWAGIRIEVAWIGSANKRILQIAIGEEKEISGTGLRIKAVSFLPAFQMDGHEITSRSNDLENPAAQIEVFEGGRQIFNGWLFSLYPTTHAFTHSRYSLSLIEGVAAEKK